MSDFRADAARPRAEDLAIRRLRWGTGVIYLAVGGLYTLQTALAVLCAAGKLPRIIPAQLWSSLYFAQFLFLILAGLGYLAFSFRRLRAFYYEVLADFLIGVAVFIVLFSAAAALLAKGAVPPSTSLLPGIFLLGFGAWLKR